MGLLLLANIVVRLWQTTESYRLKKEKKTFVYLQQVTKELFGYRKYICHP